MTQLKLILQLILVLPLFVSCMARPVDSTVQEFHSSSALNEKKCEAAAALINDPQSPNRLATAHQSSFGCILEINFINQKSLDQYFQKADQNKTSPFVLKLNDEKESLVSVLITRGKNKFVGKSADIADLGDIILDQVSQLCGNDQECKSKVFLAPTSSYGFPMLTLGLPSLKVAKELIKLYQDAGKNLFHLERDDKSFVPIEISIVEKIEPQPAGSVRN